MEIFNDDVLRFIDTRDWPIKLNYRIQEAYEPEPHVNIIFFRDNWLTLTAQEQLHTTEIVREIMAKLWADGVPAYVGKIETAHAK